MMDSYGMQQELALEISSTFWKTALGTQAPAMGGQEQKEKPAKKPLGTQAPTMAGQEKNEKPSIFARIFAYIIIFVIADCLVVFIVSVLEFLGV